MDLHKCSEILHQNCIQPPLIKRQQIVMQLSNLTVFKQGIYGQIYFSPAKMRIIERFEQVILRKIICVCARPKAVSAEIYRICPGIDHRPERLRRSGRRKQFHYRLHCFLLSVMYSRLKNKTEQKPHALPPLICYCAFFVLFLSLSKSESSRVASSLALFKRSSRFSASSCFTDASAVSVFT